MYCCQFICSQERSVTYVQQSNKGSGLSYYNMHSLEVVDGLLFAFFSGNVRKASVATISALPYSFCVLFLFISYLILSYLISESNL